MMKHLLLATAFGCALSLNPAQAADQAMIDAAKKEGEINWYTSQIVNQYVRPAISAFEKKYGIKVNYFRGNATDIALKVSTEAKAGRVLADVVDGTTTSVMLMRDGHIMQWVPDNTKAFDKQFVDPNGYWAASNFYVLTPGINTEMLKKADIPKTYADLLDPKWKGKMVWNATPSSSAAPGFVGTVLETMGEEKGMAYLRELTKQNPSGLAVAARQVLDQVIAGEYAIALNIFNNHAVISAAKGAPVDWVPMNPALAVLSVISVTQNAPHPNAGRLLLEFLLSEDGQKIYRDADYLPVDPNVPPNDLSLRPDGEKFKAIYKTPEEIDKEMPRWAEIFKSLFR
jgi:iron(III) transport system substrate-binding protein